MIEKILADSKALLTGHFLLTSGRHSQYYVEKIKIIHDPASVEMMCRLLCEKLQSYQCDIVVGPAYGGIVLAYEVAKILGKKFVFTQRKDEKMTIRTGFEVKAYQKALIIEDIVTTGGSIKEVVSLLDSMGVEISAIACIVDRSNGLASFDADFVPLHTMKIESWEADSCPLCKEGIPLVKPGASDKAAKS
jgi:orotate phosphoribosyltransferase